MYTSGVHDPRTRFGQSAEKYLTSAHHSNQAALQRLVEIVQPNGGTVVDVATGAGHTAFVFAPYVERMIATDITPNMLKVTRGAAQERRLHNLLVCFADAEALPFRNQVLTGLTCRVGAHHFKNVERFVEESYRAIQPGGWFLLVDTTGSEDPEADAKLDSFERLRDPSHVRNLPPSQWTKLVESRGFQIRHQEVGKKPLEVEDWMERMMVSPSDRETLRNLIAESSGEFRSYLAPFESAGQKYFNLDEMILYAVKQ